MGSHHRSLEQAAQILGGFHGWGARPASADKSQYLANGGSTSPVERQQLVSRYGEHPPRQEPLMNLTEHGPHAWVGRMTRQGHVHGFPESLVQDLQHPKEGPRGSFHPGPETPKGSLGSRAEVLPLKVTG